MKELAELVGVTPRSITNYETGKVSPCESVAYKMAEVLSLPFDFFLGDDLPEPTKEQVSFRSASKMSATERDSALASGGFACLFDDWISERFYLPAPNIPDLSGTPPEIAAEILRKEWKMNEGPVPNLVHLLESKGVRVYSMSIPSRFLDAFSFWQESKPFVLLNTMKSGERGRYDGAHELGHLVLHQNTEVQGREVEAEANSFASAFLMPRADVLAHAKIAPKLSNLIALKARWAVSLAAMVRRLFDLGVLTEWQYRNLSKEMARKGFLKKEPSPMTRESSQVLNKVFKSLRDDGVTRREIASQLKIQINDLSEMVFGLALTVPSRSKCSLPVPHPGPPAKQEPFELLPGGRSGL